MPDVGTRDLVLRVATTDFSDDVSSVELTEDEDSNGFPSYLQARSGGVRKYGLKMTMKQNTTTTALWYYIWDQKGASVAVEVWTHGRPVSGTPSAAQPKFTGTCVVSGPSGTLLGGEANPAVTARQTVEVEWAFTAKPTLATS